MSAKDKIHDAVRNALKNDGWEITDDPLTLEYEDATVFVDLGAERVIAAERNGEKIAVEIKTFGGRSALYDAEQALGQYILYLSFLEVMEPDRKLWLAISGTVYDSIFQRRSVQLLIQRNKVPLLVVDVDQKEIVAWIS